MVQLATIDFKTVLHKYCSIHAYNADKFDDLQDAQDCDGLHELISGEQLTSTLLFDVDGIIHGMRQVTHSDNVVVVVSFDDDDEDLVYDLDALMESARND